MAKWVKQLTRENTLLDRSLRLIAYRDSIKEIGKATMSNILIVGQGRVTSLYYQPADRKRQEKIILNEFKEAGIKIMSDWMVKSLEQGYFWAQKLSNKKLTKKQLIGYYREFNKHHAHARGVILYGYWGEPKITAKLKAALKLKIGSKNLDLTVSLISAAHEIAGHLNKLYHAPIKILRKKWQCLKELRVNRQERELAEILSWFTFFYEVGERVADYLYDQLLNHLAKTLKDEKLADELTWYDPDSLSKFLKGKKLPAEQLRERKNFYLLKIIQGRWQVLIGEAAKGYYQKYLADKVNANRQLIKGTTACLGRVRGTVKIIIIQADQHKMNQGDILVSPMTTPRLMTAVKKAAAIVTDEGGLTAHAATVAREFNIPCIVGTKIATKVLKDGDRVEVDATKGVVRKL